MYLLVTEHVYTCICMCVCVYVCCDGVIHVLYLHVACMYAHTVLHTACMHMQDVYTQKTVHMQSTHKRTDDF
jgi:hypothetical protein